MPVTREPHTRLQAPAKVPTPTDPQVKVARATQRSSVPAYPTIKLVQRSAHEPRLTPISAVILTRNEADRLERCVRSLHFCDEILVIDAESTDGTAELAQRLGARVIQRPWPGFRSQREFAIAQARHDWILSIDADESVSPALFRSLLRQRLRGFGAHAGFEYPRALEYHGRYMRYGNVYPDRAVRLFDRSRARYGGYQVHERLEIDGPIGRLDGDLEHHSYRSFDDHLARMQTYARLWAEEAHAAGKRARLANVFFNPLWRFVRGYLLRSGFRDGWRGLVFHCVEAGYVRQKYLRLYLLSQAKAPALSVIPTR